MASSPGRPRTDPLIGSAIAIVSCLYFLFVAWLVVGGGDGWPWWLIVIALAPLIIALLAYVVTFVMEVRLFRRQQHEPPRDPGSG